MVEAMQPMPQTTPPQPTPLLTALPPTTDSSATADNTTGTDSSVATGNDTTAVTIAI